MNRPLGFCVFSFSCSGSFRDIWCLHVGFQSIQTLAYARVSMSGPKKNGIVGHLRYQAVFMTLEFLGVWGRWPVRTKFFFHIYLVFGFMISSL